MPTVSSEASTAGPRPNRMATPTTDRRKTITMLAPSSIGVRGATASVTAQQMATLHA